MQKISKRISSLLLAIVMCLGITAVVNSATTEYVVADAAVGNYYSSVTADSGTQLLGQLHDLMVKTHSDYTTYGDCSNPTYVKKTDPGSSSSYVMEFYSQADIDSSWGSGASGTWNREHVWPKSLSNGLWTDIGNGGKGGGADMHHIRPAEVVVNSTRGNHKFGVASGGKTVYYKSIAAGKCDSSADTFEPINDVKGDVARIVMYVYMHYNKASNVSGSSSDNSYFGTLNFSNVMSANETEAKKLLLEWNKADPVDDVERTRNEAVYEIQGNRNPFIDHPEYAEAIWGDGTVTPNPGGDTSTTLTGLTISPSTLSIPVGGSQTLSVTATPSGASNAVTWTSSNQTVATVSGGTVTAKVEGTTTITATSTSNSAIKATAKVTVTKGAVAPDSSSSVTINISKFKSLSSSYGFQQWSSDGIGGIAYINGGEKNMMQFNNSKPSYYIASNVATPEPITGVTVVLNSTTPSDKYWKLLTSTSSYGRVDSGNPESGNNQGTVTVPKDDSRGASWTVSGNDTYFALVYAGSGVCYIDSIIVTYGKAQAPNPSIPLESLTMNVTQCELHTGDNVKLSVEGTPSNAVAEVDWTSSDSSVATVAADGTVTAIAAGTATITATSKTNPAIKVTCTVTVKAAGNMEKINAFHTAVEGISNGTLAERRASIIKAINAYKALSDSEKTAVQTDVDRLNKAIADYNSAVNSYNKDAENADKAALSGFVR